MKQSASYTEGPVPKVLYSMAMPMVWGLLATMSFNAIDTFFVAMLGDEALAAMGFTFPVVMVVTSLAIGLGAGTSSVIARTLGQGDTVLAKQLSSDAVILALVLSAALMILGFATMEPLFLLLGAEPELIPKISEYMVIWYLNAPMVLVFMVISALMRATGHTAIAGKMMLISAVANCLLDPLLIFGWGPIPRMEIEGAALATLLARLGMMVMGIYYIYYRLRLAAKPHTDWSALWGSWKAVLHIGLPAMGTNIIIPLASGVTVALVAAHGANAVAGMGVAIRIEPIALIAFYALSSVVGPFFGQNSSATHHSRQLEALRAMLRFCMVFGVVVAMLLIAVSEIVVGWFSDNQQVIDVAVSYLLVVPFSYGFYGLVMSVNASFNGIGKPFPAMVISVMRVLGLYLPLALALQYLWGLQGLFIATMIVNVVMGAIAYLWLRRDVKKIYQQVR